MSQDGVFHTRLREWSVELEYSGNLKTLNKVEPFPALYGILDPRNIMKKQIVNQLIVQYEYVIEDVH